jgi:5-formyltetrahydrofolate cyclo-ligase
VDEGTPRLLLEGRPGIGKTTVARRLLKLLREAGVPVGGFTTRELRTGGRREGFMVEAASGAHEVLAHVRLPGPPRVGRYGVDLAAFDRVALPALREPGTGGVVVVDELGRMELASAPFRDAVVELLERDVAVVATVHRARHQLTDALKRRRDVRVLRVTEATRDALPRQLMERLRRPRPSSARWRRRAGPSRRSASASGPCSSASGWPASRAPRGGSPTSPERRRPPTCWPRSRRGAAWVVKANPDAPQLPVRTRALADGKLLYMAVPRLAAERPFILLDPGRLDAPPRRAASIAGSARAGRRVGVAELQPVDLVVCGSVAVNRQGARVGKGGGFSDLEFALLAEAGLVGADTVVATTVHPLQVLDEALPETDHDFRLDLIVAGEEVITCRRTRRPQGILWEHLDAAKVAAIPALAARAPRRTHKR